MQSEIADALYEESGGNPFYLEQLARPRNGSQAAVSATGDVQLGGVAVPSAVIAALAEELALLSDDVRRVLEGAAVAGDPFDPELTAATAGVSEDRALEALDALLRLDIVRPTDVPRRFRFRHPLVRRAVYEATPGAWRLPRTSGARRRCTRAARPPRREHITSSRRGASATRTRSRCCARPGRRPPSGPPRAPAAGSRPPCASRPRARPPMTASRCMPPSPDRTPPPGTSRRPGPPSSRAWRSCPATRSLVRVRLTAACAGVEQLLGRHEAAHARLLGALDALGEPVSDQAVELEISLALNCFFRQDYDDARRWSERALGVARPLHDRRADRGGRGGVVTVLRVRRRRPRTRRITPRRRRRSSTPCPTPSSRARLDAAAFLAGAELYLDRFERAIDHSRPCAGHRARHRPGGAAADPHPDAHDRARRPAAGCRRRPSCWMRRSRGRASTGNRQGLAWNLLNRCYMATRGPADSTWRPPPAMRASTSRAASMPASCRPTPACAGPWPTSQPATRPEPPPMFVASGGGDDLPLIPGGWRAHYLDMLTTPWLELGRRGEARARRRPAPTAVATATGLPMAAAWAHRAAAAVALDAGDRG